MMVDGHMVHGHRQPRQCSPLILDTAGCDGRCCIVTTSSLSLWNVEQKEEAIKTEERERERVVKSYSWRGIFEIILFLLKNDRR